MINPIHLPESSQEVWRYWFGLSYVEAVDSHLLQVDSQYLGAKDPGQLNCKLQVHMSDRDLVRLHKYIGDYIKEKNISCDL